MNKLLSRTSVTVDEAVAILLGWAQGPIEYSIMSEDPSPDEIDCFETLVFSLQESLQDELDKLEGALAEAQYDKMPEKIIAEKQAAIRLHHAVIEQAQAYLCAIHDEINKGESSALHVDTTLSNRAYTYITLHSFDDWAKQYGRTFLATLPKITEVKQPQPNVADQGKPRARMREQEEAILDTIRRFTHDPKALPKNDQGQRGVKARVRDALESSHLFEAKTAFKKAWDRLMSGKEIIYSEPSSP